MEDMVEFMILILVVLVIQNLVTMRTVQLEILKPSSDTEKNPLDTPAKIDYIERVRARKKPSPL